MIFIIAFFLFLLVMGFPIMVSLGIPAIIYAIIKNLPPSLISYSMYQALHSFPLIASPLFILVGSLVNEFGETELIYNFARILLRKKRGYTARLNVLVSLIFSGISGAAVADIGGLGQIEISAMEKEGFSKPYGSALTAATSIVGPIFPPSVPLIIYAVTAQVSTLRALIAGIIPALGIAGIMYLFVNLQIPSKLQFTRKKNIRNSLDNIDYQIYKEERDNFIFVFKKVLPMLLLIPLIVFSMLFGLLSPSEAGAGAIIYILLVEILKGKFKFKKLFNSIVYTYKTTATIFIIIALASFFMKVLTLEKFPQLVTTWFLNISQNPIIILLLINLLVLIVGMFMETVVSIIILTPILLTITNSIGVDPIHLGIILVYNLEIGMFTPPFGVGVFTVSAVGGVSPDKVFKELIVLYIPLIIALIIITYIPQMSLFLPKLLLD